MRSAVSQRWLKPMGVTRPKQQLMRNEWLSGLDPDNPYVVITGPKNRRNPPPFARGHRMLLHAVGYSKIFAEVVLLGFPRDNTSEPGWSTRFPWEVETEIVAWVERIDDGPPTAPIVPKAAFDHVKFGANYVGLDQSEFDAAREALLRQPFCRTH